MPKNLYIGTSGWVYSQWDKIFYPEDLSSKDKLKYFSKNFKTAEVNYSFYRLPKPSTYRKWHSESSAGFIFAIKASRFITHVKRLKEAEEAWKTFIKNTLNLKEKLGPILFQFPANFKANEENTERLEKFLQLITKRKLRYAFEFRHESWCEKKFYSLFRKYKAAWVIADSPSYPKAEVITSDFIYIRMHGSKVLFISNYTKKELQELAKKIKNWLKAVDVYVYFNNDAMGYAVENAKMLKELV